MDQAVHLAAEHLSPGVAQHLGGGGVDDGDPAFEVDAVDTVGDGFEDGIGLTGKGAKAAFGANLLADIHAEAEDVGVAAGGTDELVPIGDDARLLVGMGEMEEALRFTGLGDLLQIVGQKMLAVGNDEFFKGVAEHVGHRPPDGRRAVAVDGEKNAAQVVGADHAERAFDEQAVTGFALSKRGFGGALRGDVDAGGDNEGHLALVVAQRRDVPGDAAEAAVAVQPFVLKGGREVAGAELLEVLDRFGNGMAGMEFVPGITADERGEVIAGGDLAGAVEADDAARGVHDHDQCADGVEDRGDEVALGGEGGFDALAVAGSTVDLADPAVEFEAGGDLAAQDC